MERKLHFVQFIHPGGEHEPDQGETKSWNTGKHKRKFLKQRGRYLDGDHVRESDLVFWGEWEPESQVIERISQPFYGGPRYIYAPYWVAPPTDQWRQNTDPFVFGDRFHYTTCRQYKSGRPTQLRWLDVGSVILFGSCFQRNAFVLDTVFVVDDYVEYRPGDLQALQNLVSTTYRMVTIERLDQAQSYRLYFGAMYEQPRDGMFSFFPCLPYVEGTRGFARPRIEIPGIITDNLYQGFRLNPQASVDDVRRLWNDVGAQVTAQGVQLGLQAQLPEQRVPDGSLVSNTVTSAEERPCS